MALFIIPTAILHSYHMPLSIVHTRVTFPSLSLVRVSHAYPYPLSSLPRILLFLFAPF